MTPPALESTSNIPLITIVCGWTLKVVALLSLCLWIWVKDGRIRFDEILLGLASITTLIMMAQITWVIVDEGQGKHKNQVSQDNFSKIAASLMANETIWGMVNTMIRISVLLFTCRIFRRRWVIWTIVVLIALSTLYGLAIVLQVFLICQPMEAAYDTSITGRCGNQEAAYLSLEISGLVIDLGILALPIPEIWQLHMATRKKLELICLLSVGAVVIIITGLRIRSLRLVTSADFTYSEGYLGLLSILGALLSIITCCLPTVWLRLLNKIKLPNPFFRSIQIGHLYTRSRLPYQNTNTEYRTSVAEFVNRAGDYQAAETQPVLSLQAFDRTLSHCSTLTIPPSVYRQDNGQPFV